MLRIHPLREKLTITSAVAQRPNLGRQRSVVVSQHGIGTSVERLKNQIPIGIQRGREIRRAHSVWQLDGFNSRGCTGVNRGGTTLRQPIQIRSHSPLDFSPTAAGNQSVIATGAIDRVTAGTANQLIITGESI